MADLDLQCCKKDTYDDVTCTKVHDDPYEIFSVHLGIIRQKICMRYTRHNVCTPGLEL